MLKEEREQICVKSISNYTKFVYVINHNNRVINHDNLMVSYLYNHMNIVIHCIYEFYVIAIIYIRGKKEKEREREEKMCKEQ